ncbi:response regulator transcription factor [Altererythrobacter sp. MF3-039]
MENRRTLHIVDSSSRVRAELARIGFNLGHHAEVYGNLAEFTHHPPRNGIVLLRDDPLSPALEAVIEQLAHSDIWLPVLAMDTQPSTARVVAAIKAGALEYLSLPIDSAYLSRVLASIAEEAEAYGKARRRIIEARNRITSLSNREREVLDWLSRGSSNKVIARELEISPRTVEIHRANMMSKLGASHAADAVRLRIEAGLAQGMEFGLGQGLDKAS